MNQINGLPYYAATHFYFLVKQSSLVTSLVKGKDIFTGDILGSILCRSAFVGACFGPAHFIESGCVYLTVSGDG